MKLKEWMDYREINPDDGIAITIATTGIKANDHLPTLLSMHGSDFFDNFYIEGPSEAEIDAASEFSGITAEYHKARVTRMSKVLKLALARLKPTSFFLTYRHSFINEWLGAHMSELKKAPMLDLVSYVKVLDRGDSIPGSIMDIESLGSTLEGASRHIRGYSFQDVMRRFVPPMEFPEGMPLAEKNTYNLYCLYQNLLAG